MRRNAFHRCAYSVHPMATLKIQGKPLMYLISSTCVSRQKTLASLFALLTYRQQKICVGRLLPQEPCLFVRGSPSAYGSDTKPSLDVFMQQHDAHVAKFLPWKNGKAS